jgi:hypothetical protein
MTNGRFTGIVIEKDTYTLVILSQSNKSIISPCPSSHSTAVDVNCRNYILNKYDLFMTDVLQNSLYSRSILLCKMVLGNCFTDAQYVGL